MTETATNATTSSPTISPLHASFDLSTETTGRAVPVFDGVWLIATRHRPGLSKHMFEINNRCFVFRLLDHKSGRTSLLVANAVDPAQAIPEVHRLERETGLPVTAIVSPGGGHHLHMAPWHAAFPGATLLVGPERIPRTANGRKLIEMGRVETMSLDDPFPQFRGQLEAVVFHGLGGPADHQSAAEGARDTRFAHMTRMFKFMTAKQNDPVDELWLHHVPSQTVIGGENLTWYYPKAALRGAPFMLKSMIKPDQVTIMTMARKVAAPDKVAACWRRILSWPCRTLLTYHDVPGSGFVGDGRAALAAAVDRARQPR
ncbi:MAG TPA: hypothetical protein VN903_01165 [Polyangia bacterium]|jgi:hypothetical protein|nr:hypothetical protein [Polyangia bacterium]